MTMEQRMHELLCAYALGEADAAQRIEVERALAASAELRAELERIEGTIGLVRETLGEGEAMSQEAEKALLSAVNPEPRRECRYSRRGAATEMRLSGGLWLLAVDHAADVHVPEDVDHGAAAVEKPVYGQEQGDVFRWQADGVKDQSHRD